MIDTVVVDGIPVRLKGVAAPEAGHYDEPGEPGGEVAKAFMVELVEGHVVVCDLTQERTRGRRAGWCYRDGRDVAAELIRAGLARDCPRYSAGRYAVAKSAAARERPFPGYCRPRWLGSLGTSGCCSRRCSPQACWSTVRAPDHSSGPPIPRPSLPPPAVGTNCWI